MPPNPHPLFVHFTLGLLIASVLCDLLGLVLKRNSLHSAGWWNLAFGALAALAAVATGLYAEWTVEHDEAAHRVMEVHKAIGLAALGLTGALFTWRSACKGLLPKRFRPFYLSASVVLVSLLAAGGYYGGELVYKHGVAVQGAQGAPGHPHEHSHNG